MGEGTGSCLGGWDRFSRGEEPEVYPVREGNKGRNCVHRLRAWSRASESYSNSMRDSLGLSNCRLQHPRPGPPPLVTMHVTLVLPAFHSVGSLVNDLSALGDLRGADREVLKTAHTKGPLSFQLTPVRPNSDHSLFWSVTPPVVSLELGWPHPRTVADFYMFLPCFMSGAKRERSPWPQSQI